MIATPNVLEMSQLRVAYKTRHGLVRAVQDASLHVAPGEAVGLVGESGSGKSTLARTVLGLLAEQVGVIDGGRISVGGVDVTGYGRRDWVKMRGRPAAIVFQDPLSYLNPVMRIGRQIGESVERHDPEANLPERVAELLELVKLPRSCARAFPHELSGGMRQRVLLAIALGCRPELLVADEPTTALDVTTQAEILVLLRDLRARLGMALLLISHDLAVVSSMCDRLTVMYAGCTVETGASRDIFANPAHPYTSALMHAARIDRVDGLHFSTIKGDGPQPTDVLDSCPFEPRCDRAVARCAVEMPPRLPAHDKPNHQARCWCMP